jgi:TatD DNase family protein
MIDTHCHLDIDAFAADRDEVIARAAAAGVIGMLVPAIRPRTWPALRELAARHHGAGVRWAVGIHPQIVPELAPDELTADIARASAGAIAIGETGLDGGSGERDVQEQLFRAHIRAARELRLPLVIHVLRAHDAAPRILREERAGDVGGVLHSYSGGAGLVGVYRDLGMAFAFAGPVTYANARRPLEAARAIPPDLLLAETDAPDQTPASQRGSRSEPSYLGEVIAGLARARSEPVEATAALTIANARRVLQSW